MARQITDMETWLIDNDDRIFRYLVYRRMFTPYEQQRAFVDESQFESNHYTLAKIEEAIDLGNGDWLLGLRMIIDDEECSFINYHRLSDIRLEFVDDVNEY